MKVALILLNANMLLSLAIAADTTERVQSADAPEFPWDQFHKDFGCGWDENRFRASTLRTLPEERRRAYLSLPREQLDTACGAFLWLPPGDRDLCEGMQLFVAASDEPDIQARFMVRAAATQVSWVHRLMPYYSEEPADDFAGWLAVVGQECDALDTPVEFLVVGIAAYEAAQMAKNDARLAERWIWSVLLAEDVQAADVEQVRTSDRAVTRLGELIINFPVAQTLVYEFFAPYLHRDTWEAVGKKQVLQPGFSFEDTVYLYSLSLSGDVDLGDRTKLAQFWQQRFDVWWSQLSDHYKDSFVSTVRRSGDSSGASTSE